MIIINLARALRLDEAWDNVWQSIPIEQFLSKDGINASVSAVTALLIFYSKYTLDGRTIQAQAQRSLQPRGGGKQVSKNSFFFKIKS